MEKVTLFDKEHIRRTRAEIEAARADANREFFEKFGEMVEKDAEWAYRFCRDYDRKTKGLPSISTWRSTTERRFAGGRDCLPASCCCPTGTRMTSNAATKNKPKRPPQMNVPIPLGRANRAPTNPQVEPESTSLGRLKGKADHGKA